MIQCHWAYDIRTARKRNDADAIVWTSFDEFSRDFFNRVDACRFLTPDREIFGQHRAGNVEYEHNVDSARFDLREALAELRTREGNHEESKG